MGAYSLPIPMFRCAVCHGKATEEVFNTFNARCGHFCAKHAKERVAAIDARHVPNDGRVLPTSSISTNGDPE